MTLKQIAGATLTAAYIALGATNPAAAAPALGTTTWNYAFGDLITGNHAPSPADTFATLSVSTNDNKNFTYDLYISKDLTTLFGSSAYAGALSVNTLSSTDPRSSTITDISGVSKITLSTDNQKIGTVTYDFTNNIGKPGNELTGGEHVTWTTRYEHALPGNAIFGSSPFALDVNGIQYTRYTGDDGKVHTMTATNGSGEYLGKIVSSVPEPESYAMLLAGLGVLGLISRRKNLKTS
jgi:hypothetical protein